MASHLAPCPKKLVPYFATHATSGSNGVVVTVLVRVVLVVAVVVRVLVADVVCVDVLVEVGVDVMVVVRVLVGVVVCDVVGVVTSQPWNPPAANAVVMPFSVAAASAHDDVSISTSPKAHPTFSELPAGPRNSCSGRAATLPPPPPQA